MRPIRSWHLDHSPVTDPAKLHPDFPPLSAGRRTPHESAPANIRISLSAASFFTSHTVTPNTSTTLPHTLTSAWTAQVSPPPGTFSHQTPRAHFSPSVRRSTLASSHLFKGLSLQHTVSLLKAGPSLLPFSFLSTWHSAWHLGDP